MHHRLPLLLLATLAAPSAQAAPGDPTGSATIEWSYRPQRHIIVRDRLWPCREDVCSGTIASDTPAERLRACRAITRRGDRVLTFETASGRLDEAELAACNRGAG